MSKLLALLKIEKSTPLLNLDDFSVLNEAEKDLNIYMLSAKTFKNNMLVWERETSNIINDIFKSKPEYQIREALVRPGTAVDSSTKAAVLTFSSQLKTF